MKKIFFLILFLFTQLSSNATHIIGGEIYVEWVAQNQYIVHAKIYRDNLSGGAELPNPLVVGIYQINTNNQEAQFNIALDSSYIVSLGDPCYTPDPSTVQIQAGLYHSTVRTIPNYAAGYYIQAEIYARNTLALNLNISAFNLQGMSFFCEIPDPLLGENSSPILGNYPADSYFCVNTNKTFNFNATDPDGDSLYYELTAPLRSIDVSLGAPNIYTYPGSGAYPYYPIVPWATGYDLNNIVGGAPMTINPITGDITAAPSALGFYTFAVKIEEYRNSVKIGEIRRDIQYGSLNCSGSGLPNFLNSSPIVNETIEIPYNKLYCKDLIFKDPDNNDTLYIEMMSPIFDSGAYIPSISPDENGNITYFYNGSGNPVTWNDSVVIPPNQTDTQGVFNTGTIAKRFCWTPTCNQIGLTFPFQVNAYSLGCNGKVQDSINFNIKVKPPTLDLKNLGDKAIPYGSEYCRNIVFHNTDIVDVLKIEISSELFSLGAYIPTLPNNYQYKNYFYPPPNDFIITNVPNGAANTTNIAKRFCWTPDCDQIGKSFSARATISSLDCPTTHTLKDTINFTYTVTPPFDSLDVIPNTFTPNGDGINDVFTLGYYNQEGERVGGVSNPCSDHISIKIYSRWGQLVYESQENPEFQWDGTGKMGEKVATGTYFVIINGFYGGQEITLNRQTVTIFDSK
jgi:gliding motility-associated-like protein